MAEEYHSNSFNKDEEILKDYTGSDRYVLFPVKYHDLYELYKKSQSVYWVPEEIVFSQDIKDLDKLNENEKFFIFHILAFFAASDGLVMENLALNFFEEVKIPEARQNYAFQNAMEAIHSETYSLLINTYCRNDLTKKEELFRAVENFPAIKEKAEWAMKWIGNGEKASFAQRLIAFSIVEGLQFSSSFCSIFWIRTRGLLPGLTMSNDFISRDEGLHTDFAVALYRHIKNRVPERIVHKMFKDAVDIEKRFITESIRCSMIGMNEDLMKQYIEYIADRLLGMLGYTKIYNKENPFTFMELGSVQGKTNFFDKKNSDYQRASIQISNDGSTRSAIPDKFEISDDF
tara:strand:+ start:568 stop:1602 length:1035 start_codon:yes stop_codon:yes gene_type:complete